MVGIPTRDNVSFSRMPTSVSFPNIKRKRSKLHGYGVFAAETIPKNARVIDYAGELVRNDAECEAREERYLQEGCIWVFRVNRAGAATRPSAATSRASSITPARRTAGSKSWTRRSGFARRAPSAAAKS